MNRREVLLLLAGTGATPDALLAMGRAVHKRARGGTLRALNAHQNETVAAIAELIIPKTDTPGAREAGVPAFIDVMLADWAGDDQRQMFTAGLGDMEGRAPGPFWKEVVALHEAPQTHNFQAIHAAIAPPPHTKKAAPKKIFHAQKML